MRRLGVSAIVLLCVLSVAAAHPPPPSTRTLTGQPGAPLRIDPATNKLYVVGTPGPTGGDNWMLGATAA
jgi:hypothetical protein